MIRSAVLLFAAGMLCVGMSHVVRAELTIGMVSRAKGQETNTLQGVGVVVGLKGTGDKVRGFEETANSLVTMLKLSGYSAASAKGIVGTKNAALVSVLVTVPGTGAREGTPLDCQVASMGTASSLKGGQLLLTAMAGPVPSQNPLNTPVFGQSSGNIVVDEETPTRGRITNGCRLVDDFLNPFELNGVITLVVDTRYSDFGMATAIEDAINEEILKFADRKAQAINQNNVVVPLPPEYRGKSVRFLADVMQLSLYNVQRVPTVTINENSPSIVIDGDVELLPTTVTHGDITITIAALDGTRPPQPERFSNVDPTSREAGVENMKLRALQESLNAVNVSTKDMITIIKMLDTQGSIRGRVEIY